MSAFSSHPVFLLLSPCPDLRHWTPISLDSRPEALPSAVAVCSFLWLCYGCGRDCAHGLSTAYMPSHSVIGMGSKVTLGFCLVARCEALWLAPGVGEMPVNAISGGVWRQPGWVPIMGLFAEYSSLSKCLLFHICFLNCPNVTSLPLLFRGEAEAQVIFRGGEREREEGQRRRRRNRKEGRKEEEKRWL